MSKAIKAMISDEYRTRYDGVESACVVDLSGLTVQEQEAIRASLRERSARMEVVKNRLVRRVFEAGPLEALGQALEGPCALVTTTGSMIDVAKSLVAAAKEFERLELKHALLDGDQSLLSVVELSRLKGRTELLGEILALLTSPGRAVAGCVRSPASKIAGCLQAIADKAA